MSDKRLQKILIDSNDRVIIDPLSFLILTDDLTSCSGGKLVPSESRSWIQRLTKRISMIAKKVNFFGLK